MKPETESPQKQLPEIRALIEQLHRNIGLDVSIYDDSFLLNSIKNRQIATSCLSPLEYLDLLSTVRSEQKIFQESLCIVYSEFFRNPLVFALLEELILPMLIAEKEKTAGTLRVWSAGCATGQEAWSLAILLDSLNVKNGTDVACRIFATDLCEALIPLARSGVYTSSAVGNVSLKSLGAYFSRQNDSYTIIDRLKEQVEFSCYDLLDEQTCCPPASIFGSFDIILCCNLFFYYRPEIQRQILNKLRLCLAPGGYLITDPAERQIIDRGGGFSAVIPTAPIFKLPG